MINIETYDINADSCKTYSIELDKLLEFVKKIRLLIKTAKFHVIRVLSLKINKLKLKQKAKAQEECGKLKNKQEEIDLLHKADLDCLAKKIFANKYTNLDLEKLGDKLSLEERVIIRLFSFNQINQAITEFRSQHSDWEELVDVILYKNTGGKLKVNKLKNKKQKLSIPLPYGVTVIEPIKKEVKIPSSIDKKSKKLSKIKEKSKTIEKIKEEIPVKIEDNVDIPDEELLEFIRADDDLDEWEKEIDADDTEELNLMVPLAVSLGINNRAEKANETRSQSSIDQPNRRKRRAALCLSYGSKKANVDKE